MKKGKYFVLAILLFVISLISTEAFAKDANVEKEENVVVGGGYAVIGELGKADYFAEMYDVTNDLPTSEANYILSSSDGYVWLCGYSGIIKYDGSTFKRLDASSGLTSGRAMFEDSKHRIWVGTNDSGVVVIEKGKRTNYTELDGLTASSIRTFAEDAKGNVFIGTTSGISYITPEGELKVLNDDRINTKRILRLSSCEDGTIYGYTKTGEVFAISSQKIILFYTSEGLHVPKITNIYADPENNGKVYIGTQSNTLYYGRLEDNPITWEKYDIAPLDKVKWITKECGRIWVTSETRIGYFDVGWKYHVVEDLPMNNSIEMMTTDYQGNIWVASSRQGVMKVVANNFLDVTGNAGIPETVVNTTYFYRGSVYAGTDEGLLILDKHYHQIRNALTEYVGDARVRCLTEDNDGNLWIATFTNDLGLLCYTKDGKIKRYTVGSGLPSNEIRCINIGRFGDVLVGTNEGFAVIQDGEVILSEDGDDLKNPVILDIQEVKLHHYLIATDGDGIYEIKGSLLTKRYGWDDGLTSKVVMKINWDKKHELYWIITSNSIEYLKDGIITNVSTFPYNNNFDVLNGEDEDLWILSSCGIFCVQTDQMLEDRVREYRLYNLANGLTSMPIANERSYLASNGDLYIAGMSGVCKVNLNNFWDSNIHVVVDISSVVCDDKQIFMNENGEYVIPSRTHRIQISPAILDYTMLNPTVKMFFENEEDSGITIQRSQLYGLEYTGLSYGKYILHIQILDNGTGRVIQDSTFTFIKQPRFFERTSVKISLIFLLAAAVGLIVWRVMTGTVIRQQYEQIQLAKDEAERANMAKSRFLANMSHEIRTPINTIMGMNEIILREDVEGVPKHYFMSVVNCSLDIHHAAESLLGLINEILDISKIESGKMHLVEQEYDTVELFRAVISMIKVKSQEKDLSFRWEIDENIPKKLYGDAGKVKQIVLNLLTNAVKYTPEGGFVLKVTMENTTEENCTLRISVKDTGIGVKPEDLDKLFTAYERLDEEKNSAIQGTGLGLDISRRFAELMNGRLWCESEYGKGSEFILLCPQKIVDASAIGAFKDHEEFVESGPYVPQFIAPDAKVLVVDDNPMNLNVFKGLVKPTKVQVTTADSGQECLDKVKQEKYDIIFLDHMMPGMDGLETMEKLREIDGEVPVFALTANTMADPDKFYKSKGFEGYLAKPIDAAKMEETMLHYLEAKISSRPLEEFLATAPTDLPEDMLWLNNVKEISVEDGVRYSGGMDSFIAALDLFLETLDESIQILADSYNNGDFKLYTIKTHGLKSSARIIGALELSAFAEKMEAAGKKDDIDFIKANHEKLLEEYRRFEELLAPLKKNKEAEVDDDLPEIGQEELQDAYDAMKELVTMMDYDGVEMVLEELAGYHLPEADKKKVEKLSELLKRFDWENMDKLLS